MTGVEVPQPGPLWVVVAVAADGAQHLSAHTSRNAAMKAARRCRDRGENARAWFQPSGEWLSLAETYAQANDVPPR